MLEPIGKLRVELLRLGCPASQTRRMTREMADHYEDLRQAALDEGATPDEAEARATTQLGDPAVLASKLVLALRQSSWWGRHPVAAFCLLPILAAVLLDFCGLTLALSAVDWPITRGHLTQAEKFRAVEIAAYSATYTATALAALLFCWLARRSALDRKWIAAVCLFCSAKAWLFQIILAPHNLTYGCFLWPAGWKNALCVLIPLVIGAAIHSWQRKVATDLTQSPAT